MKLVTSSQMQQLDRLAIEKHSIPSLTLMERAGRAVADAAAEHAKKRKGAAVVVCGRGNNGGDGLVAARLLIEAGHEVAVFLLARSSDLSPDARANWERLAPITTHIYEIDHPDELKMHHPVIAGASVIVDAIFGTGLAREITGPLVQAIEYLNAVRRPIVAVDIPSGLSADRGISLGVAIRAAHTVTFGLPKLGLYIGESEDYVGRLTVADIGIPNEAVKKLKAPYRITDHSEVSDLFPPRKTSSHKGTYGHVAVVAGSGGKLGAGYLACMAALRAGAGLVTYFLPQSAFEKFDARYPEIMCEPIPDKGRAHFHPEGVGELVKKLDGKSVLAIGPAMGTHDETKAFVHDLVAAANLPMVIDADGLNNLDLAQVKRKPTPMVLTPHPGEFSRLIGITTEKVQRDRLQLATKFATQNRVHLVLKGHYTVIAMPDGGAYINPTGGPAMASAGMGDALTGAIAGLIAQKLEPSMAAVAATYVHGLAGDMSSQEIGDRGVVASDVIRRLPTAIRDVAKE